MSLPSIGQLPLRHAGRHHNHTGIDVRVVRSLDDLQRISILRALTYMSEQACPYDEEFDGNDLCALHLIAFEGREPVGTLRLRFFNDFCKIERVCIDPRRRGGAILVHLMAHAFEIASRKGYRRMLAHMQTRLEEMWRHVMECNVLNREQPFDFSGMSYLTLEIPLPEHPDAIRFDADPFVLLRPEGDWDRPGVLDPRPSAQMPEALAS
ncbi:MAG TPA: GNAT family N-acetyltransferase [Hyphomonadaceae bacterium]|nr:GNAT family N-acetyltransferase [Hyphomonadaceae bacterium]